MSWIKTKGCSITFTVPMALLDEYLKHLTPEDHQSLSHVLLAYMLSFGKASPVWLYRDTAGRVRLLWEATGEDLIIRQETNNGCC